jgi:oligosaccharide translocation protein RFT1
MYATASVFWWQSIQKWLLENGEKIVLVFLGTTTQQGVYVVVDRLGSIVVRLLFQPAEEMSLATLGKLTALRKHRRTNSEGQSVLTTNKTEITEMVHTNFAGWLLLLSLIGLTFACFGTCYSHLLLHILYGAEWSSTSAPSTLGLYCVYIFFMATNGICEAFVQGTSTSEGIGRYNRWMVVFSVVYMCSVYGLLPLFGASGLILANMIKMMCRISVCAMSYVRPYFRERDMKQFKLSSLLPHSSILTCFAGSFVMLQCTSMWLYLPAVAAHAASVMSTRSLLVHVVGHVLIGAVCLSLTWWLVWKHHGKQLKELLRARKKEE